MYELNENLNSIKFEENFLNEFVKEFAFLHSIDEDLVKIYLFAFLGNALADRVILNPTIDSNYLISPNLWAVNVSPPGTKKSIILQFFKELFEDNTKFLDIATKEAVIEEMSKIKHGIFAVDELSLLLNKIKNDAEYRSFMLTGWNGYSKISKKTVSRKHFNEVISFGIVGNIQPDTFFKLIWKDDLDDGLVERFQLIYFNPNYHNVLAMYNIPDVLISNLKNLFEMLNSEKLSILLKNHNLQIYQNRFVIKTTLLAKKNFVARLNILRLKYKELNDNKFLAFIGKIDKVVGSIALIQAILRGINTKKFEVNEKDIFDGFEFAKYTLYQFFKIKEYFNANNLTIKENLKYKVLRKIVQKRIITKRELIQQVAKLKTVNDVNKILEELIKDGIKLKIEKNQIIL